MSSFNSGSISLLRCLHQLLHKESGGIMLFKPLGRSQGKVVRKMGKINAAEWFGIARIAFSRVGSRYRAHHNYSIPRLRFPGILSGVWRAENLTPAKQNPT